MSNQPSNKLIVFMFSLILLSLILFGYAGYISSKVK
jgi:hypothetical protein